MWNQSVQNPIRLPATRPRADYLIAAAIVLAFGLTTSHQAAASKVYKWVDDRGNVQYSQTPPPSEANSVSTLKTRKSPISDDDARKELDRLTGKSEEQNKNRELLAKESNESDDLATRRKENCETAKKNLAVLATSQRVQTKGDDGKPFYLTDEVKQKKLQETRTQITEFCN